ncbi:PucR family transcriptional regulator [Halalkalibacter krulwichiae]|uniref:Purine catabolism regulatory protein n=1 Tax=Halalkalibacter krulwichiae TaxID=199441 RepID=A0A1Y9TI88_9BACI|nr:helix-turn-helix domain-containing protein [Halalkalibacter krulwichiae]ARK28715.1 Purine catabolism regulatory protein [Halalkalibacter krulwichiae]
MDTKKFDRVFDSLEDFVDTVSETLNCPVTLEDANHQLLAYSSHDDTTDAARISTIIGRRVPEKVVNRFWKEGVIPTLNQSDEPLDIEDISDIGLRNRVAVSIRKNQEVLGYIWVIEVDTKLTTKDKQLLKLAASKAKNLLLQLNMQKKRREKNHQELLWQIITGDTNTHEATAKLLEKAGITAKSLSIMIFHFNEISDSLYRNILYIIKTTSKVTMLIHTIDDNRIICLVNPNHEHSKQADLIYFMETLQVQMKERFNIDTMHIGSGYLYEDYAKLTDSFQEAQKVVELKHRNGAMIKNAYFYHELGVFRHLDLLLQQERNLPINPAITKIQLYDKQHASSLYETLEVVLDKDANMNEAAKELHIHVNTLSYRLKRIQEITNIQLKDPIQRIGLYLDMKLYRLSQGPRK